MVETILFASVTGALFRSLRFFRPGFVLQVHVQLGEWNVETDLGETLVHPLVHIEEKVPVVARGDPGPGEEIDRAVAQTVQRDERGRTFQYAGSASSISSIVLLARS